jgi:hypothetical protein
MNANLRPMSLGEILDRTFQIYRAKFLVFVGIAAIPAVAIIALEVANRLWWGLTPYPYSGNISLFLMQWTVYSVVLYQVVLLLHLLIWPSYSVLASQLFLGEDPKLTALAFRGNASWRSWLWMAIASWGTVLILPELVLSGLCLAIYYLVDVVLKVSEDSEAWLMPKVILVLFIIGYMTFCWLSSAFFIAVPAKAIEKLTVRRALRRSWILSRGTRWRILFTRLLWVVAGWLLYLSLSTALLLFVRWIILSFRIWWHYYSNIYTGIGFFMSYTASTLIGPIFPIALTLFYYDQRMRLEGYDIEKMMEAAGMNASVTTPAESKVVQA